MPSKIELVSVDVRGPELPPYPSIADGQEISVYEVDVTIRNVSDRDVFFCDSLRFFAWSPGLLRLRFAAPEPGMASYEVGNQVSLSVGETYVLETIVPELVSRLDLVTHEITDESAGSAPLERVECEIQYSSSRFTHRDSESVEHMVERHGKWGKTAVLAFAAAPPGSA
jgi:hypothetical protein